MVITEQEYLVPLEKYLKAGLHIGTKFRTKYMGPFIYKIRPDGLAVLNMQLIDQRLKIAAQFLAQYEPQDIIIIGRRENSWKSIKKFADLTGIRCFAGRYPPGTLTNPNLEKYTSAKLILVADPWPDKNAVRDAVKMGVPVVALCDTNNESNYLDLVIPCNNKGKKSLGLIFYILAKEFLKAKKIIKNDSEFTAPLEDFVDE
ncbi:MAG: 30S ribosomal protein S2 [Candidatus Nanoarchaeia archaeon]|nr:30S ribosomal protein S2 [Candidatus Nanoarchaeia archaeon]